MDGIWTMAAALGAALLTALGTWILQARKLSGRIQTSEAADLWREAADIRRHQYEYAKSLEDRLEKCMDVNGLLDLQIQEQREQINEQRDEISALRQDLEEARGV